MAANTVSTESSLSSLSFPTADLKKPTGISAEDWTDLLEIAARGEQHKNQVLKLSSTELSELEINQALTRYQSALKTLQDPHATQKYKATVQGLLPSIEESLIGKFEREKFLQNEAERLVSSGTPYQNFSDSPTSNLKGTHTEVPEADLADLTAGGKSQYTYSGAPLGVAADWSPPSAAEFYASQGYNPNEYSSGYLPDKSLLPQMYGGYGNVPIPEDASESYKAYVDTKNKNAILERVLEMRESLGLITHDQALQEKKIQEFTIRRDSGLEEIESAVTGDAGYGEFTPRWVDTPGGRMFFPATNGSNGMTSYGDSSGNAFAPLTFGPFNRWVDIARSRQKESQDLADTQTEYENNPAALERHQQKLRIRAEEILPIVQSVQNSLKSGVLEEGVALPHGGKAGDVLSVADQNYLMDEFFQFAYEFNKINAELRGDAERSAFPGIPAKWARILELGNDAIDPGYRPFPYRSSRDISSDWAGNDPYAPSLEQVFSIYES